jgi:hypothetical protein
MTTQPTQFSLSVFHDLNDVFIVYMGDTPTPPRLKARNWRDRSLDLLLSSKLDAKSLFFLQEAVIGDRCNYFEHETPEEWDRYYKRECLGEYSSDEEDDESDDESDRTAYKKALEIMWSMNSCAHESELPCYVNNIHESWYKYMDETPW